jgi:hypothetical protein
MGGCGLALSGVGYQPAVDSFGGKLFGIMSRSDVLWF